MTKRTNKKECGFLNTKNVIIGLLGLLVLAVSVSVGSYLSQNETKPRPKASVALPMKIALRVPSVEVYNALKPYSDGTKGQIPFIFYAGLDVVEDLKNAGALTSGAELGTLIGCDTDTINNTNSRLTRFINAGVTYLMMDCEKGPDNLWASPDVLYIAGKLAPIINGTNNFRWQIAMQFGYLTNKSNGSGGDLSLCGSNNLSSCDFASSYAGQSWQNYDTNDVFTIFGQSGSQTTPEDFEAKNTPWLNYMHSAYPQNDWWGVSGLTDKDGNGSVDFTPQTVVSLAQKAQSMGAEAFGIIWLGRTPAELFGQQTEMDVFLDSWARLTPLATPTLSPTPTLKPSPTPTLRPTATPTQKPTPTPTMSADTINPKVKVTFPKENSKIDRYSFVNITATASDKGGTGIEKVEFYVNGTLTCSDPSASYSCEWRARGEKGEVVTLRAKAIDRAGNSNYDFVRVTLR